MSRIDLQIVATGNFAAVEGQLARLKSEIASLNAMGMASNPTQLRSVQNYTSAFSSALAASGMFQTRMVNLTSETERFGKSLERGHLRLGQYFKAGSEYARKHQGQIRSLAREQVRMMNSTSLAMGDGRAMVVTPKGIDEAIDKQKILNQEHRIFRQVVQGGATQLINWGKNTQWAGRQLTVGLTVPLTIFGAMAGKVFMDADKQLTRMAKVYGDASKGMVNEQELDAIRGKTIALAQELASTMGVAVQETIGVAADIAATGKEGNDLLASTREAVRLSVLGEVDRQEAMKATLAIQSVFKQDSEQLADSINLLNAVENQTSTTLNDLVAGIIKAGPVVQGLGGDIADLASMMVAMREGGVPAAEAANAIKSSLGGLINPTKQTTELLKGFGINLTEIVDSNAGDVIGTLTSLQSALEGIDELSRQRAIEQMFGKFQFSRINALLNNLNKAGSQTEQVLKIAGMSTTQLAQTADRELKLLTESASMRFQRAVESLKASLIPIGETFVEVGAKILEVATTFMNAFNDLPPGLKNFLKGVGAVVAIAGPIIMITGVLGNFFGYIIKTVGAFMALKRGARGVFEFYNAESMAAQASTKLLSSGMFDQVEATNVLKNALETLNLELQEVAKNMKNVGSASVLAGQQARTMAGATTQAVVASNNPIYMNAEAGSRNRVNSFERSHFMSDSERSPFYGSQATATLLASGSAGANFQQHGFKPTDFYGEGAYAGLSRAQIMAMQPSAQGQAGQVRLAKLVKDPSGMRQLLPSRAEYNASMGQYMATIKALDALPKERITEITSQIKKHIASGRPDLAKRVLERELVMHGQEFRQLMDTETKAIASINGTLEQVTNEAAAREAAVMSSLRSKGRFGFHENGKGLDQFLYATAGGGVGGNVRQESGSSALLASMGGRFAPNNRILGQQAAIDSLEEQRLAVKRKMFKAESNMSDKLREADALAQQQRDLEQQRTGTKRNIAKIDKQIELLAAQEAKARRSAGAYKGQVTRMRPELADITAAKREAEANREVMVRRRILGQLIRDANVEQSARAGVAMALKDEKSGLLRRTVALEKTIIGDTTYYAMINKFGQTIGLADASKKKIIAAEEISALKYSALQTTITREMESYNLSQRARDRVNAYLNSLSNEIRDQVVSHELVQQANGRYTLALRNAEGQLLAEYGSFGQNTRLRRGIAGAGMVAGMGTMFMTGDNSASKIGGGALMGLSMGAMTGNPMLALGGLVAGGAIPAVMEFQKDQQAVNDKLIKYGEALNGSSLVLDAFAKEAGKLKASEKMTAALSGVSMPEASVESGKALLDTESGQRLLEAARSMSGDQLSTSLSNQLKQLTLLEIFTPEEAKDVANALAVELGNPALGQALVSGINSVLNEDGTLKDSISQLFAGTIQDIKLPEFDPLASLKKEAAGGFWDSSGVPRLLKSILIPGGGTGNVLDIGSAVMNPILELLGQPTELSNQDSWTIYAQENIGVLASQIDKLREAQALATNEFMAGKISYQEYSAQLADVREKNIQAADAILKLKEGGADVGAMLKDIADQAGRGADYAEIENMAKGMFESLSVGERFLSSVQVASAYGDLTTGDMKGLESLIQNEDTRRQIELIFDVSGAEDSATEIIKLFAMGMTPEFIADITVNAKEIGKPLNDVYAVLTSVAKLPTNIQKTVIANVQSDPTAMNDLINKFEYASSLPDTTKELKMEVFGNDYLTEIQDNWKQFIALPDEERKTAVVTTLLGYEYSFAETPIPTPTEVTDLTGPDTSAMMGALDSGSGGGSGGGGDNSEVEKAFDKKIKQQDKIIKQIQKEREERQKLLDLEKKALDFAMSQQDLENQIMIAKAEGRVADAAMLQSQLDANRISDRESEKERLRQEEEDRRIRRAEREKKRLEREKEKATGGGSGGSGGGGSDDAATKEIERRLEFLNNQLTAALNNNIKILDDIDAKGAAGFWDSEPIKNYIREAQKLGIPLDVINAQLETTFDYLVTKGFADFPLMNQLKKGLEKVGIAGTSLEKILPNIFAIMQDTTLSKSQVIEEIRKQFEEAGMTADEARKAADKFFKMTPTADTFKAIDQFNERFEEVKGNFTPDEAKILSEEFAKGIRTGATKDEIWSAISRRIHKSVYEDSDLNAEQADEKAAATSQALKNRINTEFKDFGVGFPVESEYKSNLPDWLENGLNKGYENKAMRALGFTVEHDVNSNIIYPDGPQKIEGTVSISGVNVANGGLNVNTRGAAGGGIIRRGTGGMIYGPGGPTSDSIPTMLSNGEYVIKAASVNKYGIPFLDMVNMGMLPAMASGGYSKYPSIVARMSAGGGVYYKTGGSVAAGQNVEYNIEVNVAGTNASADEIASKVMSALERKQRMNGTVNRV